MGLPKLSLPFGPELMLQRVVRLLREAVEPIVVVAAPEQELPPLPEAIIVVRDRRPGRGPLEGLAAGLAALPEQAEAAYITSCDVPLLVPAFVLRMVELLGVHDIAVPVSDGFRHPLAAVYRRSVLGVVEQLIAADQMRPAYLFETVPTRFVTAEELANADPQLKTLENLNDPQSYVAALERAGFAADPQILAQLKPQAAGQ